MLGQPKKEAENLEYPSIVGEERGAEGPWLRASCKGRGILEEQGREMLLQLSEYYKECFMVLR